MKQRTVRRSRRAVRFSTTSAPVVKRIPAPRRASRAIAPGTTRAPGALRPDRREVALARAMRADDGRRIKTASPASASTSASAALVGACFRESRRGGNSRHAAGPAEAAARLGWSACQRSLGCASSAAFVAGIRCELAMYCLHSESAAAPPSQQRSARRKGARRNQTNSRTQRARTSARPDAGRYAFTHELRLQDVALDKLTEEENRRRSA
jgi:hypothetical protein